MTDHLIPPAIIKGRVYHKPKPRGYAYGSTLWVMEWAARHGYDGMDWDRRVSKDGVGFWFHQKNPTKNDAWFDPTGHIKDSSDSEKLTAAELRELRFRNPADRKLYAVMDDRTALTRFKRLGLVPCVEDKSFSGLSVEHWTKFKALADEIGVVPVIMSLPGSKSVPGTKKLKAAHDAGLVTMWLWRTGSKVPDFVDLVKSHLGRPIYRVSDRPIGPTAPAPEPPAPTPPPTPTPPRPEAPMSKLPDDLPKRLRAAGLKVNEVSGWQSRGRPASTGSFHPVGVLCHHTATGPRTSNADVLQLLIRGRSDLPGPLAHFGLDRSGVVHIVAAGRANHAGKAKASGSVAAGDGNSLYIGIEAFNDGRGEGWPDAQYDAYVKLCAVLSREITGNSAQTVRGHKETSVTGKVDPLFSMGDFRDRVAAALKATPPKDDPTPTIPEKEPGMKDVEYGRLLATKAAQAFDDAKVKGKPRPAVRVMAAAIRAALKAGPKK